MILSRGRKYLFIHAPKTGGTSMALALDEIDDLFLFTMVRNPWDRMVSYYHWLRAQSFEHPAVDLANGLGFDAFVAEPLIAQSFSSTPAASYVTDAQGVERKCHYIRLEHLAQDIAPLEAHLGFALDIPHVNRSARSGEYVDTYSDEARARVAEFCAVDIARFGYHFESTS